MYQRCVLKKKRRGVRGEKKVMETQDLKIFKRLKKKKRKLYYLVYTINDL